MKSRMMISMLVIALVAAVIGGGTMAWFTAKADAPVNEFTAGTVMIDVGEEQVWGADMENVNPGDCFLKCIEITNTGSKNLELRLEDVGFAVIIDWEWIGENFEALCFTEGYEDVDSLKDAYADGAFEIPAFLAPCPDSGWAMQYVKDDDGNITGFEFYYNDGPIAPGETVSLCLVVEFNGEMMGNIWQGAEFNQINGVFQAVQASNDAPDAVWGAGWDWAEGLDDEAALREGTSNAYADYFWVDGEFQFKACCENVVEPE